MNRILGISIYVCTDAFYVCYYQVLNLLGSASTERFSTEAPEHDRSKQEKKGGEDKEIKEVPVTERASAISVKRGTTANVSVF